MAIRLFDMLIPSIMVPALLAFAATVVGVALGFVLAYGLLDTYVLNKNATATAGGASMKAKCLALQSPLGVAGIVLGVVYLILILA